MSDSVPTRRRVRGSFPEAARQLGVRPRVPMLRERRLTTDLAGTPVEWSDDRYLGSAVAFSVRNSTAVNALSRTPRS